MLYWGAVNWAAKFKRDYSGGWKSKVADYKRFSNSCRPYTGPTLPFMIAACDAPDGSHWALQQWQRLWSNYGGDRAANELYISHWRGDAAELAIQTDYSYHGKHQHLWGKFTFHGKPVFGTNWTLKGVPTDKQGRNVYVDFLKGPDWRRVNSFLTHPPTAGFCYTFANHPASIAGLERAGHGRRLSRDGHRPGRLAGRADALLAARPVRDRERRRRQRRAAAAARPTTGAAASTDGGAKPLDRPAVADPGAPVASPAAAVARRCRARACPARAPRGRACSAGSPTPMAVPGPASNVSSPTAKRARPEITTKSSCWSVSTSSWVDLDAAPAARPRSG